jgi:hypothetical protein
MTLLVRSFLMHLQQMFLLFHREMLPLPYFFLVPAVPLTEIVPVGFTVTGVMVGANGAVVSV